jgi:hypothetical protein
MFGKLTFPLALALIVCGSSVSLCEDAEKPAVNMKYALNVGDCYIFNVDFIVKHKSSGNSIQKQCKYTLRWTIKKIEDDNAIIAVTFNRVALVLSSKSSKIRYDSARTKDNKDAGVEPYAYLVGRSIIMNMNRKGVIDGISGYSKLAQECKEHMKKKYPILERAGIDIDVYFHEFNDTYFEDMLKLSFLCLPEETAKKESAWSQDTLIHVSKRVDVRFHMEHKISSLSKKGTAKIKIGGKVWRNKTTKVPIISNKIKGSAEYDPKKGGMTKKSLLLQCTSQDMRKNRRTTIRTIKTTLKKYIPAKK